MHPGLAGHGSPSGRMAHRDRGATPACPQQCHKDREAACRRLLTPGLFLHHLIKQVNQVSGCLSRTHFMALYPPWFCCDNAKKKQWHQLHMGLSLMPSRADDCITIARFMLRHICTSLGISVHRNTGYPMQPRIRSFFFHERGLK